MRRAKPKKSLIDPKFLVSCNHHHVSKTDISPNALKVLSRLHKAGFEAYVVGGSVRDLLLRKAPKDFDVATNATPNQIRDLFRNARIIGRRFKLAHILYHREIIEVTTFRGHGNDTFDENQKKTNDRGMLVRDNVYGSLEEDAWRRDFAVNALYYNAHDSTLIDFTGGFPDITTKSLRILGDPMVRYKEDPVRMLRAVRFCAKLHFHMVPETAKPILHLGHLITHISGSRLFDEMVKLYQCGEAVAAHRLLVEHGLFAYLFKQTFDLMDSTYPIESFINIALENTDKRIHDNKPVTPAFIFAVLLWFPLLQQVKILKEEGMAPLPALEKAMSLIIMMQNQTIAIPKRFTQTMREMWIMQYRFPRRMGGRAYHLLEHPRFRAAYDFLLLRAIAGDESVELADWWTTFQESTPTVQQVMIEKVSQEKDAKKEPHTEKK